MDWRGAGRVLAGVSDRDRAVAQHRQGACHDLKDWFVFLQVSLAAANDKPAHLDRRARNATTVNLGVPIFPGNR